MSSCFVSTPVFYKNLNNPETADRFGMKCEGWKTGTSPSLSGWFESQGTPLGQKLLKSFYNVTPL